MSKSQSHVTKQSFLKHVIAALESKSTQAAGGDDQGSDAAARAFAKLQYDFPIVSALELQALEQSFRDAVRLKDGWFPYQITAKMVSNAVAGALQSPPAQLSTQQPIGQQPQQQQHESSPGADAEGLASLQAAYHKLCSAIFIFFMKKALSLPDGDAWALMERYQQQENTDEAEEPSFSLQHTSAMEAASSEQAGCEDTAAAGPAACAPQEAAQLDDDDFVYEDMAPQQCGSAAIPPQQQAAAISHSYLHKTGSWQTNQPALQNPMQSAPHMEPGSWDDLQACILHLGSCVSYAAMSHPQVWSDPATLPTVLELLRVLGIHDHSAALQQLMHAYMNLLADRMCEVPADLVCLKQLWEALGIDGLASAPRGSEAARRRQAPGGMPPEAASAFSLVAHLATHYTSVIGLKAGPSPGHARQELWRQIHQHVLGLADHCLDGLTQGGLPTAEQLASVNLICQVLLFYIRQRPGSVDAAKQLLQAGVVRSLTTLLPKYGGLGPGAEPLRLLGLLCAACSPEVCRWMLAVPGLRAWVESKELGAGGMMEAHGSVWQLLRAQQQQQQGKGKVGAEAEQGGDGCSGLVLPLQPCELEGLPRLHSVLQLMYEVHAASDGRVVWGSAVQGRLRALASELRSRAAEEGNPSSQPSGTTSSAGASASPEAMPMPSGMNVVQAGAVEEAAGQNGDAAYAQGGSGEDWHDLKVHGLDVDVLKARRSRQLVPECMRILKGLLTAGGKTD